MMSYQLTKRLTMSDQPFYPKGAGLTKAQVLEMIRFGMSHPELNHVYYGSIRLPDENKLTDELMQRFVEDWWEPVENAIGEDRPNMERARVEQAQSVLALAVLIQQSE
jgi:hypothetical protein